MTLATKADMVKCDSCNTPALRVVGTTLVIEHRHHGEKHVSVFSLQQLLDKMGVPVER